MDGESTVKSDTLSEKAYHIIKEKITGFENGSYLSAREFSNEIGMSYTPVREALIRLQREKFLQRVPNVGFFVVRTDIKDVIKIFQVRECIEKFVFEEAFDLITDKDIHKLVELVDQQKRLLKKGDIKQYTKKDNEFHHVFFELYDNDYFISIIENLREQYFFCSNKIAKYSSPEALDEHIQILDEIKAGNKEQATACLQAHIKKAILRMKEGFISEL